MHYTRQLLALWEGIEQFCNTGMTNFSTFMMDIFETMNILYCEVFRKQGTNMTSLLKISGYEFLGFCTYAAEAFVRLRCGTRSWKYGDLKV